MKTFTEFYLGKISEALIDKAMAKGKWMTQAEVERMHQVTYRGGMFMVRHRDKRGAGWRWFVAWDGQIGGTRVRVTKELARADAAFEAVRREVDRLHDSSGSDGANA